MYVFFIIGYWKSRGSLSILILIPTLNGIQILRNYQISESQWQVTCMDEMRFIPCMERYKRKIFVIQIKIFFDCNANNCMFWRKCKSFIVISYIWTQRKIQTKIALLQFDNAPCKCFMQALQERLQKFGPAEKTSDWT